MDDTSSMSTVGSSLETSPVGAIQAPQIASKTRDRDKSERAARGGRRFADLVEVRSAGAASDHARRGSPGNESEGDQERELKRQHEPGSARVLNQQHAPPVRIDVKA